MRKLAGLLAVTIVLAALVAATLGTSQFRGRYQLRLGESKSLIALVAPTR